MVKHKREEMENGSNGGEQSSDEDVAGEEVEEDESSEDVSVDIQSESEASSEEDDEDVEEESSEEGDSEEDNTVQVNLGFRDPTESDFHGLKAQLQNYLDGGVFACSELVDTIIAQVTVGTVVKSVGENDDDEEDSKGDPLGVITVLSTERYRQLKCLEEIKAYLLSRCEAPESKSTLEKVWGGTHTGLVVHERLINCPQELAAPLLQALFDEVAWATEDEPNEQHRDSFKFEHYIFVTRVYADRSVPAGGKQKKQEASEPKLVFIRKEDEYLLPHAAVSYHFPTGREEQDGLEPRRLVMLLTQDEVKVARGKLDRDEKSSGSSL